MNKLSPSTDNGSFHLIPPNFLVLVIHTYYIMAKTQNPNLLGDTYPSASSGINLL